MDSANKRQDSANKRQDSARRMAAASADVKRVRFKIDEEPELTYESPLTGQWEFLKYLLTMKDEFNHTVLADHLVKRGILGKESRDEILKLSTDRARTEACLQRVMKAGPGAYHQFCEALKDSGYSNVVEALSNEDNFPTEIFDPTDSVGKSKDVYTSLGLEPPGTPSLADGLAVRGVKMSLSALSKDARASQREFSVILERQADLEKQLMQVMRSLDVAKETLVKERQEKINLREQMKEKDTDLYDMQKKYLELQKAMGMLRETNNKYHEKVTKLQLDNEQLRKANKDKTNLQTELVGKNKELERLKQTIQTQERQISLQEDTIIQKLNMIEKLVSDHKNLAEGQEKLTTKLTSQSEEIKKLTNEKNESSTQMAAQQKQLNFQQAQLMMLTEQMQRIESHMVGVSTETQTPQQPDNRKKYMSSISKPLNLSRPFNAAGKAENSKSIHWREDNKRHK